MIELDHHICRRINGGNTETSTHTELITSNKHMHCECVCIDRAELAFQDESDDTWVWWLLARPYNSVKRLFSS